MQPWLRLLATRAAISVTASRSAAVSELGNGAASSDSDNLPDNGAHLVPTWAVGILQNHQVVHKVQHRFFFLRAELPGLMHLLEDIYRFLPRKLVAVFS